MLNEILDNIDKLKTKEEKFENLRKQSDMFPELKTVLAINYNYNNAGFVGLPIGTPDGYKPDYNTPIGYSDATLAGIHKKLYIYSDENLNAKRKAELFLQEIEALHPLESEILLLAKDMKLSQRYPWMKEKAFTAVFG